METELTGQLARLPDGQLVKIEIVHSDGYATVRRIDGELAEQIAVCKLSSLKLESPEPVLPEPASDNASPSLTPRRIDSEDQHDPVGQ